MVFQYISRCFTQPSDAARFHFLKAAMLVPDGPESMAMESAAEVLDTGGTLMSEDVFIEVIDLAMRQRAPILKVTQLNIKEAA